MGQKTFNKIFWGPLIQTSTVKCLRDSYCSAFNVCTCLPGMVVLFERCVDANKVRLPGEVCKEGEDFCSRNSWCFKGKCECIDKKEPVDFDCNPIERQGSKANLRERYGSKSPEGSGRRLVEGYGRNWEDRPKILGYKILEVDDEQEKNLIDKIPPSEVIQKEELKPEEIKPRPGPLQMKIKVKKLKKEEKSERF